MANEFVEWLLEQDNEERHRLVAKLPEAERPFLQHIWPVWSRPNQRPPPGDWTCWLICAGRGFGKTRAGAEWVREIAIGEPDARIALVGSSLAEARAVMVEGASGLLSLSPAAYQPEYEPSLKRLTWPNGAMAFLYSAGEPDSLRGPQHSHAWCDEIAKWDLAADRATRCWDNLMMGLRLGLDPRIVATTTPRPVPLVQRLVEEAEDGRTAITRGSTYENAACLPPRFIEQMQSRYGHTALGRQELDGELLEEAEGALWTRALLERCREPFSAEPTMRTVVGVDPPASARGDACGIVVCALTESGAGKVLADCSVEKASPEQAIEGADGSLTLCWARRARGAWSWLDGVEVPLNEQAESYLVGLGGTQAPALHWDVSEPRLDLSAATMATLQGEHPGEAFWVRQVGSRSASPPLLLHLLP